VLLHQAAIPIYEAGCVCSSFVCYLAGVGYRKMYVDSGRY